MTVERYYFFISVVLGTRQKSVKVAERNLSNQISFQGFGPDARSLLREAEGRQPQFGGGRGQRQRREGQHEPRVAIVEVQQVRIAVSACGEADWSGRGKLIFFLLIKETERLT